MIESRPRLRFLALAAASAAAVAAHPGAGAAQSVVLDEGTFTVFLADREAGTESFAIRREGAGADATLVADAVVSLGGAHASEMRSALRTRGDRSLLVYQNEIEGADVTFVSLDASGRHLVARIRSTAGERERELRSREGMVLLDRWVAHQYWFLAARTDREGMVIPVVDPHTGREIRMEVASVAAETVEVGAQRVQARHVRLVSGSDSRDVWFDGQGRVLRVEVPAQEYRAVRQAL
ncbi:MAG TPA: DUF6134 family protein [Longimicrobiales bacterium]|nr:DUF6134 family protein [Longimicrobiales bacterium]